MLIKNALLMEFVPGRLRENTDLRVEEGLISEIGQNLEKKNGEEVLDSQNKILYPGLVCSHHHYYSGLARGIMANIGSTPDFVSTLRELWWRMDRALDKESTRISSIICSLDAIRSGTTSVIDHHSSPSAIEGSLDSIREGFSLTGLRGATCYEVTDRNGSDGVEAGVSENVRFANLISRERKEHRWDGLFESHIGGHAPFTMNDEVLRKVADAVESTGRGFHVHVAEDQYDVSFSHAVYGKNLIPRLQNYGLINKNSIIAHGLYLDGEEIKALNESGAFLVSNSRSNMNNNVGYNVHLPEYKNVALGTDGIGGDMFEELKFAYFKHRDEGGPWFPGELLNVQWNGNKLLERIFGGRFGVLEVGAKADFVIADYNSPTPVVPENIGGHFVFGMNSSSVETVVINGKIVLRNKEFSFDLGNIYEEAREQAQRLWTRMNKIKA